MPTVKGYSWTRDIADRYVCARCNRVATMEVWVDSRAVTKGSGYISEGEVPADADPPPLPTLFRCNECAHEHEGPPAQKGQ